jgi:hypothetical protein
MLKAKDVEIRAYDSFLCPVCKGGLTNVRHFRGTGQSYVCVKCDRHENVKSVLTREYKKDLAAVASIHRAKVLDMMQRDVVRWFKNRNSMGVRANRIHQETMDFFPGGISEDGEIYGEV